MDWRQNSTPSLLIYAVIFFFICDGTALALNSWLTKRIQAQTIELNLAGRQRMLSQKMVKELFYSPLGAINESQLTEFKNTIDLFDRTLGAFRNGGTTINTDNTLVTIQSFSERSYFNIVKRSWNTWLPLREEALNYIASPSPKHYIDLNKEFANRNDTLLNQMNDLTLAIEKQAHFEISQIKALQGIALLLGMVNFLIAYWLYRHRLKSLEHEKSLIDSLLHEMPLAVAFTDDKGNILKANRKFSELLAVDDDSIKNYKIDEYIIPLKKRPTYFQLSKHAFNQAVLKVEKSIANDNGKQITIWRIEDISHDIAEREQLSNLAYKDSLTNLDNREAFKEHLETLQTEADAESLHAIMFLDLNNFKHVNDNFGHNKGDAILKEVGIRLQEFVGPNIKIARHGGDEFTILLQDIDDEEQAIEYANRIRESLRAPLHIDFDTLHLDTSIGITSFRSHHKDIMKLISNADKAMYHAKFKKGVPNIHFLPFNG